MRRPVRRLGLVAMVLAAAVAACSQSSGPAPSAIDARADTSLARTFLQQARETADPTYYTKADALLARASAALPGDADVLVTQGSLALSRHRFADAYRLGHDAVAAAPRSAEAWGVVVDAANELGRYDEALEATQRMVDLKPGLASYSRVSYARELRGDVEGATAAMAEAARAGGTSGENVAYVLVQLGQLYLNQGDVAAAERSFDQAEAAFPGFPSARAGRARALVAQGEPGQAADLLADVVRVQPLAENVMAEGDALTAAGRPAEAAKAYALVGAIAELYTANGVDVDLELALFDADHGPGPAAVDRARRAEADRPSVLGHDVLAWNLYQAGMVDQAAGESTAALRLGSRDPQTRYHAAAIAFERGDRTTAAEHLSVVLSTNPRFSAIHAAKVTALAAALGLQLIPA